MRASEAMLEVDSLLMQSEMTSASTIFIEVEGMDPIEMETEILASSTIAQVNHSPTEIDMRMEILTVTDGTEMAMTSYFRDGVFYMEIMDERIKMPLGLDEVLAQANAGVFTFEEAAISNQIISETPNGTELSFVLSGEAMSDMISQIAGSTAALFGGMEGIEMSFEDIALTMQLDENEFPKTSNISMNMRMEGEGLTVTMQTTTLMEVVQVGDITIDFPEDLDSYTEVDPSMFS